PLAGAAGTTAHTATGSSRVAVPADCRPAARQHLTGACPASKAGTQGKSPRSRTCCGSRLLPEGEVMLDLHGRGVRLCDGWTRREMLRIGGLGALGLSLPE